LIHGLFVSGNIEVRVFRMFKKIFEYVESWIKRYFQKYDELIEHIFRCVWEWFFYCNVLINYVCRIIISWNKHFIENWKILFLVLYNTDYLFIGLKVMVANGWWVMTIKIMGLSSYISKHFFCTSKIFLNFQNTLWPFKETDGHHIPKNTYMIYESQKSLSEVDFRKSKNITEVDFRK